LTSLVPVSFSRRTLLHAVSSLGVATSVLLHEAVGSYNYTALVIATLNMAHNPTQLLFVGKIYFFVFNNKGTGLGLKTYPGYSRKI
jgi:hypothetical protein